MEIDLSTPSPTPVTTARPNTIPPSTRIAELNQIDTSISSLLTNASTATSVLANHNNNTSNPSLTSAQRTFTLAASNYFSTLSSIEVRLRRQVYALEEAGLIQAGDERDARRGRTLNSDDGSIRRGGGGPLDPSWLNARVSDGVESGKKRELLALAKELVQKNGKSGDEDEDVEMDEGRNG